VRVGDVVRGDEPKIRLVIGEDYEIAVVQNAQLPTGISAAIVRPYVNSRIIGCFNQCFDPIESFTSAQIWCPVEFLSAF
jgi:hypothetical protein